MEGEEIKKERPQNKNLKPLGSGQVSAEEEYEIRRKAAAATNAKRRRNADIRAAVRAVLNLNSNGRAKSMDVEKMASVAQLDEAGAPLIAKLVFTQMQLALNGDKEARDWICRMAGVTQETIADAVTGLTVTADADALEQPGGVRIHLIRGEKPREEESEEEMATRAANRLAVVEAMQAIGEAAAKESSEDVSPDE